jgi:hypothetical protein
MILIIVFFGWFYLMLLAGLAVGVHAGVRRIPFPDGLPLSGRWLHMLLTALIVGALLALFWYVFVRLFAAITIIT